MLLLTPLQGRTKTLRQCMEKTSVFFPCTVNGPQSVTQVTQPYDMLRSVGKAGLSFGYKNLKNSSGLHPHVQRPPSLPWTWTGGLVICHQMLVG